MTGDVPSHGLGYLHDHPLELASRASAKRWPVSLLLAAEPLALPASFRCPGVLPTALDQDGIGACVAFSGTNVLNAEEAADEGANLFASGTWTGSASSTGAYRSYWDLKHGFGSFPGDGIPSVEGSFPEALWKLAKAEGLVDRTGKRHPITAYYSGSLAGPADLAVMQQALMQVGPVQLGIPWAGNWMAHPPGPSYRMPAPAQPVGGHAIACVGWDTDPDGTVWLVFVQTWGQWTDAAGHYSARADWLYRAPLGPQVYWKATDRIDAPTPPAPENAMLPAAPDTAATPWDQLVDLRPGCVITAADGRRVPLSNGGTGVWSPFAADTAHRAVRFSTGGIAQIGTVALADTASMRPRSSAAASYDAGLDAAARAVASVPRK